ncbi:MAG: hypothetical protein ACFB51_18020 [Anaerolineae bacterium]
MTRRLIAVGLIALSALLFASQPAAAQRDPVPWFGVVEPHDAHIHASELGVGWGRARFLWPWVQPEGPDQWVEAELTSEQLARERDAGRETVAILIGVADWARDADGLPRGLYLPYVDPEILWAAYVTEAVSRYAGRIDHWIIWNEPDVWDVDHPGFTWPGTVEDFVQLMRVSYLAAKDANPDSIIHLAAMSHYWDALYGRELYFTRLLDTLTADQHAARHNYYYDVATLHLYFNPADVYELVAAYRAMQSDYGIDKPLWLVETNAAPADDPARPVPQPTFKVSLAEQAAFAPQALALSRAAGADRVSIYKLIDTEGDIAANPEPFGLVRADGATRPAFRTTQVAVDRLADAHTLHWADRGPVAQVIAYTDTQVIRLLWSRLPVAQQVAVPARAHGAVHLDMWGTPTPLPAAQGVYTVTLAGATCGEAIGDFCMIGGPVIYIVEDVDESAYSTDDMHVRVLASSETVMEALATPRRPPLPVGLVALPLLLGTWILIRKGSKPQ